MDSSKTKFRPNPQEKANIFSLLFWWWTISVFKTGYKKKVLEVDDLYDPLKKDRSSLLGDRLEKRWNIELENAKKGGRRPSLLRAIFRTFLMEYSILGLMQIFNEFIIKLGTPLLLGGLLQYFREGTNETYETALSCAIGICIGTAINVFSNNQALFGAFHVGMKVRVAVCSVVYRKALRLSQTALGETAPGKVINLIANDVNRFDFVSILIHYMWSAPLSALIIAYFLYNEASYAGLIGIMAVCIVVPIQSYTGKLSSKFRLQTSIKTDERVRLMNEIISGVQVIKLYAWEKPFYAMIELARKLELRVITRSSYIRGIYMTFNLFTTRMALYCTLVSMIIFSDVLSAEKVFVFSSYFNILAQTMSGMFVRGYAELAECLVAVRRLQHFLMYDEYRSNSITVNDELSKSQNDNVTSMSRQTSIRASRQNLPNTDSDEAHDDNPCGSTQEQIQNDVDNSISTVSEDNCSIKMVNVEANWESGQSKNTLKDINLLLEKGKLYAVIGTVGSGKSSFLNVILGEMNLVEGYVKCNGSLSYANQEAWVFDATVRQNILFGHPYERQRYQRVVKACALLKDFKQFPRGDQTIVGDRGSSLSGGQKARINLARALYKEADIYLLDDPLSAVDAHVSKHLFEECIQLYLANKTRILATHQLQYIKKVDAIILLEKRKTKFYRNYQDLLIDYPEYNTLLVAENETGEDSSLEMNAISTQFSSSNRIPTPEPSSGGTDDEEENEDVEQSNNCLEKTSRGALKGSIFIRYFKAGGNLCLASVVLLLFILTQFVTSLNDCFVPILIVKSNAERYQRAYVNTITDDDYMSNESEYNYINIYTGIVIGIFVLGITRSLIFYKMCMLNSQRLHDLAFGALIRTTMRFFDTNPSGRILNRFSKDIGAIDELLPKALLDSGQYTMLISGSLIVSCLVNPMLLIPIILLAIVFYGIRKIYLKTSKNIKRLEGMTRSPVFTHLNATLHGLSTIRAYGAQEILKMEFDKFQDTHTSTMYMYIVTSLAFGFCLDAFCFIIISLAIFSFLLLSAAFSGEEVGLTITQLMTITTITQWAVRQSAEVENQMMAVERVLEYTELPPEPNLCNGGKFMKKRIKQNLTVLPENAPKNWPSEGCIKFRNVYMRYTDEDPPVLKYFNLLIHPREKIGIVGRTGAGKSSLISALFRLAKVEGVIEIDGVDTGSICLEDLRRHISIIPQDPVLFSGTLRRNLDPFDEYTDQLIWEALEEVELKDVIVALKNGLECRVSDGGSNFSVGQKQLICLARAILRNNRILMLDEATANVDPQTDSLIQQTIRKKFASCTVLTVAHRLNTIMDSDKVLVMDMGQITEYDHPHILLQNSNSQFTSLVKETGTVMYEQLIKIAKQSYVNKHGESKS